MDACRSRSNLGEFENCNACTHVSHTWTVRVVYVSRDHCSMRFRYFSVHVAIENAKALYVHDILVVYYQVMVPAA